MSEGDRLRSRIEVFSRVRLSRVIPVESLGYGVTDGKRHELPLDRCGKPGVGPEREHHAMLYVHWIQLYTLIVL